MHISDGMLSGSVSILGYIISIISSFFIFKKEDENKKNLHLVGIIGAFIFAIQMINFKVPYVGASGHIVGSMLSCSILGPIYGIMTIMGVLLVQSLFFSDGGILALGFNVFNMGFLGVMSSYIFWKILIKKGFSRKKITIVSILGSIISLEIMAFFASLEISISNISAIPITTIFFMMMSVHLFIGLVEGLVTAFSLNFLYTTKPYILYGYNEENIDFLDKNFIFSFLGIILVILFLSRYASSMPDGLEWTISSLIKDINIFNNINTKAFFNEYLLFGKEGTEMFAGFIGAVFVFFMGYLLFFIKRILKNFHETNR